MSNCMLLSLSISPYLCLPPPVRKVHCSIEAFRWSIADDATLSGVNEILDVGWLPHEPSHAFHDVSTPVFNRALVSVIPFHILESVYCPLPKCLIIWHASHELLDAIPIVASWEMQTGFCFLQHVVIVHLHAILLDPTLYIFVLFTRCKQEVGIILYVPLKATLSFAFP